MTILVNDFVRMKKISRERNSKIELSELNKIDRCALAKWSRKIN